MRNKLIILVSVFLLGGINSFSQKVVEKISEGTCSCIQEKDMESKDADALQLELGLCMLSAAEPYKKQLKSKYGIDLGKPSRGEGEKLGKLVGADLATSCPAFLELIQKMMETKSVEELIPENFDGIEVAQLKVTGKLESINGENFAVLVVRDANERKHLIHVLEKFEGDDLLIDQKDSLVGKKVTVHYSEREIFKIKHDDYSWIKIVESFNVE